MTAVRLIGGVGVLTALASCLAACAGPRPPVPADAGLAVPPHWRGAPPVDEAAVQAAWWESFGDPALNRLVVDALAHNDDIAMAAARVEQARASLGMARGARSVQVAADGDGGRSRIIDPFGRAEDQWAGEGTLGASFDLDLFGRLKATERAARAQLLATQYARDTVRLAVTSAVAGAYIRLQVQDARLAILRQTLASREASLRLVRRRFEAGYGGALDLAQADAEYQATARAIPATQITIASLEDSLSVLTGHPPGSIARGADLAALHLPEVPQQLPSRLLRRRPDLAAAEEQVVAADHALDAARAAIMPDIDLGASVGGAGSTIIPVNPVSLFSLGGSVLAPVFTGGRLQAQAQGAAARRDEAAFAYRRAVLDAFREVEDGLASIDRLAAGELATAREKAALGRAEMLAEHRYREGYSPYLEQLDAERSLLASDLALAETHGDRLLATVSLFEALGGGWRRD